MNNLDEATGEIGINLMNDLFFRILLQKNNHTLKMLIAALLHYSEEDIQSVIIQNEIEFNWVERSLSYLSRRFDHLKKGEDYFEVKPTIQIGLLDYTLFPEAPEFYATYYMMNEKSHKIYSDKFRLSVLDLTRIDMVTEEDRKYNIHVWANLFRASTWADLKMIAKNNEAMDETVNVIYGIAQDQVLRDQIRAREERIAHERYVEKQNEAMQEQVNILYKRNER